MARPCSRGAARGAATSLRSATRELFGTRNPIKPVAGGLLRFPRSSRILRSAEFRVVYDNGIRLSSPLFAAFCLARTDAGSRVCARLGLTVPRALGGAVERNRIKRRSRAAFGLPFSSHLLGIHDRGGGEAWRASGRVDGFAADPALPPVS